jgi:hypothetical protein
MRGSVIAWIFSALYLSIVSCPASGYHLAEGACVFMKLTLSAASNSHVFECIVRNMQSLSFTPGRAFLSSNSPAVPWTVVFEDEGIAGYFYACDRSQEVHEHSILDAMLIYNVAALARSDAEHQRPEPQRIASVEWSRDGLQAVLYLDGTAQGLYDFQARCGYCRMNFPNFAAERGDTWRKSDHSWSDAALQRFESSLYA